MAFAFSGRVATGDPFGSSTDFQEASGTAFDNLSVTAGEGADALAIYCTWGSSTLTEPTGFTPGEDGGNEWAGCYKNAVGAGACAANNASWGSSSQLTNRLATLLLTAEAAATFFGHTSLIQFGRC
jgi:hypothetical protein